jgi:hypothetical protein
MTYVETAHLLGSMGEFFGAIAVVVTLVFLTVQLRQNTEMIRAQINQSRSEAAQTANHSMYNSPYLPEIVVKIRANERLTEVETVRYEAYIRGFHRTQDNVYWQYRQGFLDENIPRALRIATQIVVGQSELSRQLWNRVKPSFTDEYVTFVDEVISATE